MASPFSSSPSLWVIATLLGGCGHPPLQAKYHAQPIVGADAFIGPPPKPPSPREVARRSRDGGSFLKNFSPHVSFPLPIRSIRVRDKQKRGDRP